MIQHESSKLNGKFKNSQKVLDFKRKMIKLSKEKQRLVN